MDPMGMSNLTSTFVGEMTRDDQKYFVLGGGAWGNTFLLWIFVAGDALKDVFMFYSQIREMIQFI